MVWVIFSSRSKFSCNLARSSDFHVQNVILSQYFKWSWIGRCN